LFPREPPDGVVNMEPTADNRLSSRLICPCNNKEYSSYASLKQHYKTQGHQLWDLTRSVKNHEIRATRLDNENSYLKRRHLDLTERNEYLEKENKDLIQKIDGMESQMSMMNLFRFN